MPNNQKPKKKLISRDSSYIAEPDATAVAQQIPNTYYGRVQAKWPNPEVDSRFIGSVIDKSSANANRFISVFKNPDTGEYITDTAYSAYYPNASRIPKALGEYYLRNGKYTDLDKWNNYYASNEARAYVKDHRDTSK